MYYYGAHDGMHSGHRILTPAAFAADLARIVRKLTGARRIAALYVSTRGPYPGMADVECWPLWADRYNGPYPVICHPPCGPWGPTAPLCKYQTRQGGIDAMRAVHTWGGVVEQPARSRLFWTHGRPGGIITVCDQADWGFRFPKLTLLYWFFPVRLSAGKGIYW